MLAIIIRIVPGRIGAQRHAAQVQAVIGDGQAVAAASVSRLAAGTRKSLKHDAVVIACFRAYSP